MPDTLKLRREYAARIMNLAGVADRRVEAAYAAVPREDFSGPPPWHVAWRGLTGGEGDCASLYDDVLVAIDVQRGINNGQPSLHAQCLAKLALREGETVLHIGAGAGYYTAILAHLVGPTGKVIAYEIEPDIAERARENLADYPHVELRAETGVGPWPGVGRIDPGSNNVLPKADAIYVNAAASHPVRAWLNALKPGGRLLFPLQAADSSGAMCLITRPAELGEAWPASIFSRVVFIACEGAQDGEIGRKLDAAFRRGGAERVRWLKSGSAAGDDVWMQGDGWALTTEGNGRH